MKSLAWVTDPHFNFVRLSQWDAFTQAARETHADAVLVSGDISEADDVVWQLRRLRAEVEMPVYFVLGNHDFYHGNIRTVRQQVAQACADEPDLKYLTGSPPIMLGGGWALTGDDGWADARVGDYWGSSVQMNDFRLISDLAVEPQRRLEKLRRLGAESACRLRKQLELARLEGANKFLVVTHVPPFRESCLYEGRIADDQWAPFFVNYSVGWALRRFCQRFDDLRVIVLCGHTHHAGQIQMLPNLEIRTGAATYGEPRVQDLLRFESFS